MNQKYSIVLLVTSVIAGCDAQVDSTHNGTPLAQVEGTVQNRRAQRVTDAEVALVWQPAVALAKLMPVDVVDVEGNFPAAFRISVYEPPRDDLINIGGIGQFAVAAIFAGKPGTDYGDSDSIQQHALGMDPNHLLVYLPQDVVAGSGVAQMLRGTPRAGFHIYNVGHLSDEQAEERSRCRQELAKDATIQEVYDVCGGLIFDDFLPAPDDLETPLQVELVDDFTELDVPDWS